jgi:hypothetical protein
MSSSPTTNIHVSFTGETAEDVMGQIQAMAVRGGSSALALVGVEELLAELRDRMAKHDPPMVVRVLPFAEPGETTDEAPATPAPKTRATRKAKETAAPAETTTATLPDTSAKVGEIIDNATKAAETASAVVAGEVSLDDVKAALNGYNAIHGTAKARQMMQEHGGALRLADVPADKFQSLIDALKAATPATQDAA